jgi:hypothetical protein
MGKGGFDANPRLFLHDCYSERNVVSAVHKSGYRYAAYVYAAGEPVLESVAENVEAAEALAPTSEVLCTDLSSVADHPTVEHVEGGSATPDIQANATEQ